jgi:hypothetical protein
VWEEDVCVDLPRTPLAGWYGLELVNVPLFLCIRRTTTAFTLIAEWLLLGRVQTLTVQSSESRS